MKWLNELCGIPVDSVLNVSIPKEKLVANVRTKFVQMATTRELDYVEDIVYHAILRDRQELQAFHELHIIEVKLQEPKYIKIIAEAFEQAIPYSKIGEYAFYGCNALTDVYYGGTEAMWKSVAVMTQNAALQNATIHYSCQEHQYTAVTTAPTCTEAGYTTYTCSVCGDTYVEAGEPAYGHEYSDGLCVHCGEEELPYNPFVDVKEADYFYIPVLWAVKKGITNGTSATTFSPEDPCTRGQVVTFLWRAYGCPQPTGTSNPFDDVDENFYYYKAILWAVEKGITTGLSANKFGPDEPCTRGQVATFLWRAQGKPAPAIGTNPFTDLAKDYYYYTAVLWAVENKVTNGTGEGRFSPDENCTRGQIVTFLYRALS